MVEKCYPGKPALGCCQYLIDDFRPDVLESVLATHRVHMLEREKSVHNNLSLGYNQYVAEIVSDHSSANPNFNYVEQHWSSRDVIGWGTESDFQAAKRQIEERIKPSRRIINQRLCSSFRTILTFKR